MNDYSLLMNMVLVNNTFKILNFLIRNLDLYNINQIARNLDLSVGSVHKILKSLESRDLVKAKEIGNALYYTMNFQNIEAMKYSELILIWDKNNVLKDNKTAKVYASDLEKFYAQCIILFGSILFKKEQARDVDVLFILNDIRKINDVNNFCLEISKIRIKKINHLIMTEFDFINNIKNKNKVILDIIKKGAVLRGEEIFIKSIKNAR